MSRGTQNLLLLLVGLSTAVMLFKGTYLNYVKPALLPWLITAAVVLVGLGLVAIVRDLRSPDADSGDDHDPDHDGHGHRHQSWLGWLLLVPIAMVAFVVPPPLNARGTSPTVVSAPPRRAFPPLPAGDAPTVSLPEVVMRAAADSTNSLAGRSITLVGFTMHRPDGIDLGRVVIVCCAADAQLARVHLTGPGASSAAGHPEDAWLRIQGRIVPGSSHAADGFVPTMTVTDVAPIDKPANTYAY